MKKEAKGIILKQARMALRWKYTQTQLGVELKVSGSTISRWERGIGSPNLPQFALLARVLELTDENIVAYVKSFYLV